jgi:hypothetical protein
MPTIVPGLFSGALLGSEGATSKSAEVLMVQFTQMERSLASLTEDHSSPVTEPYEAL